MNHYLNRLKTHPLSTNLGTALVLMTLGDITAQKLEQSKLDQIVTGHNPTTTATSQSDDNTHKKNNTTPRRHSLRRYGSQKNSINDGHVVKNFMVDIEKARDGEQGKIYTKTHEIDNDKNDEFTIDWIRTGTMGSWAVCFYTPIHMQIYKLLDWVFIHRKKTFLTVMGRVGGMFLFSIPNNAAFFVYGTCIHHSIDWFENVQTAIHQHHKNKVEEKSDDVAVSWVYQYIFLEPNDCELPAFDEKMMLTKVFTKLETELQSTVVYAAKFWIPINTFNFAFVAPYLRPFGLLFFTVFWNCYLSLVQHRDIVMPTPITDS